MSNEQLTSQAAMKDGTGSVEVFTEHTKNESLILTARSEDRETVYVYLQTKYIHTRDSFVYELIDTVPAGQWEREAQAA